MYMESEGAANFRWAHAGDARTIAELFAESSGGVAEYVWTQIDADADPLDTGEVRYKRTGTEFSYENCVLAEVDGQVAGMMVSFPMPGHADTANDNHDADVDPVLRPYDELEVPGSYYICGIAMFPEFRGMGLGTRFLEFAKSRAAAERCGTLSLIVFEENTGAKRLYERQGYTVVDRRAVVPHPCIRYTGDALLMTAPA